MKAYLAGPMSGYPEFNFPAFELAAKELRALHWEIVSPAERDLADGFDPTRGMTEQGFNRAHAMQWDLTQVIAADAVILMPGWQGSPGASLEFEVGRQCGKLIYLYNPDKTPRVSFLSATQSAIAAPPAPDEPPPDRESILEEAQRLIHGDRNQAYGHPLDDFTCTAGLWYQYLSHKYNGLGPDVPVLEAEDVALMMVLVKISRQANAPKRDNLVDGAGYLGTYEMVLDERERRAA